MSSDKVRIVLAGVAAAVALVRVFLPTAVIAGCR